MDNNFGIKSKEKMKKITVIVLIIIIQSLSAFSQPTQSGSLSLGVMGSQNDIGGVFVAEYSKKNRSKYGLRISYGMYSRDKNESVYDSISSHFDFGLDYAFRFTTAKRIQPYLGINLGMSTVKDKYFDSNFQKSDEEYFALLLCEPKAGLLIYVSNKFGVDLTAKYPLTFRISAIGGETNFLHLYQQSLELKLFFII